MNDADLCVKCGVCLPHCPTFTLHNDETESPRGRIALVQGLAKNQLSATPKVRESLDHCLSCGRCESVCPAQVPYARLMDGARYILPTIPARTIHKRRLMARILKSARLLRLLARLARAFRSTGAYKIFGPGSAPGRALAWLPDSITFSSHVLPVDANATALIFPGCLTSAFEQDIVDCAVRIGARLGVIWQEPQKPLCCAGLYQHMGEHAAMHTLMTSAADELATHPHLPIATVLSGCGKSLRENLAGAGTPLAAQVRGRLIDIHTLLLDVLTRHCKPVFAPAPEPVALYLPCTLTTVQQEQLIELLNHVPEVQVHVIGRGFGCCGAAGDHMTTNPETAEALITPLVTEAIGIGVSTILIPNLGCAWHWRANLRRRAAHISVCHPLQWLAAHLKTTDHADADAIIDR